MENVSAVVAQARPQVVAGLPDPFDPRLPALLFGEGYEYAVPRDPRSARIAIFQDFTKVYLSREWTKTSRNGSERRASILGDPRFVPLNLSHLVGILSISHEIPDVWEKAPVVTFDGDLIRKPCGTLGVPGIWRCAGQVEWNICLDLIESHASGSAAVYDAV